MHPQVSPPTDNPTQGRQTGSSHRYSNPQDSSQTSGLPGVPELGQAEHTNQFAGDTVGTRTTSGYYNVQSGHAAPIPSDTITAVDTPFMAESPHASSFSNPYEAYAVYAPHNSEAHFNAGVVYNTMPQTYTQGQPPLDYQWGQASFPLCLGMGAMRSSQLAGVQHSHATTGHQSSGRHPQPMQESTYYHPSHQFPPMYAASNHVDSGTADNGHYPPASNSPGSKYNGRVD